MKKAIKYIMLLSTVIVISGNVFVCSANSAEPPGVIFSVHSAPNDLEISVVRGENTIQLKKSKRIGESSFAFYRSSLAGENSKNDFILHVKTGGEEMVFPFSMSGLGYNSVMTLSLKDMTLTEGHSPIRSIILVSIRLFLTLILEGVVFYLFCFKNKRSWIVFLIINLITQGMLNLWINGNMTVFGSYNIFSLIVMEIFIVIIEVPSFIIFLKEKGKGRRTLYVLTANVLSLLVGGWLITILPV